MWITTIYCIVFCSLSWNSYQKGYSVISALEYIFLALLQLVGFSVPFSIFQSIKCVISFLFFLIDDVIFNLGWDLPIIRYLFSTKKHRCHAMIGIGENVYHYSYGDFQTEDARGSTDRCLLLQPFKMNKTTTEMRNSVFFAPCVGFALHSEYMERLEVCGKCHDWGLTAAYSISFHKFLSYCVMQNLRWLHWICFGVSVVLCLIVVVAPDCYCNGEEDGCLTNIRGFVKWLKVFSDLFIGLMHAGVVFLDISNLKHSKIEDNNKSSKRQSKALVDIVKLLFLIIAMCAWSFIDVDLSSFSYIIFAVVCFVVGCLVEIY
jgi:hypothetical protein